MLQPAPEPAAPAAEPAPAVPPSARLPMQGARRPDGRFRPGCSGNPHGRPRRAALSGHTGRRLISIEPTEVEKVLAEPVLCLAADAGAPVPLARAVVARLTERALDGGDVAACRELLRLCAEADAVRIERELLLAEREAEEAQARAEAARAEAVEAGQQALARLEALADEAARDAGEEDFDQDDRALKLLEAVDEAGADGVAGVRPWVEAAARAFDPRLPRGDRPLDPEDPWGTLDRLGIVIEEYGLHRLAGWFIDAARARLGGKVFAPGDEALLQLVRAEGDEAADWAGRWEAVVAAAAAAAAG